MLTKVAQFSLILLLFSHEFQCNHHQQRLECLEETGIDLATIENYRSGIDQPTEQVLCFIKCTFEKSELLKSDGSIDLSRLKSTHIMDLNEDNNQKIYECVAKLPPIHRCDDIVELEECLTNNNE
nr:odorant-binding protein 20 [Lytta caraganae]